MNETTIRKKVSLPVMLLLVLNMAIPSPASASQPVQIYFDVVAGLGGFPGTWSSSGLVTSSGTATFEPFVSGLDPELGIPATVHDTFTLTDEHGSINFKGQGKSAIVHNDNGVPVPGYRLTWVIISGTGSYVDLHGKGKGYAWPDFVNGTFPISMRGQAHFDPQN